ncbi:ABC transporter B family member 15-like isoform X2 [Mangifera indica]|uniref:ABC transporter B family member 15-like isoform X2 n=1 Tax=Mangifera indica TaxID=29780 RepID=UPI001CFADBBC|nr:ABC transporter B family member 15-like isoform X2 [Mangifera indica]
MEGEKKGSKVKRQKGSVMSIFMQADGVDFLLMGLGFIGAVSDGFATPVMLFFISKLVNSVGTASTGNIDSFTHNIKKYSVIILYIACGRWVAGFLGERQATRMRAKYLKAVLRQDIEYFDLNVSSTAEVITNVSNDSLVIQDAISEKLPNFLVNAGTFIGGYVIGFLLLWRLTIVTFPTVILLVIPGIICGRSVLSLARKIREEYNKAGTIAEQAISSITAVYSFVGETKTINEFSSALEILVELGVTQGLAKGWAVGSNSIVYAIWSFVAYYGARLVMYHGAHGGTVFAVANATSNGGQAIGTGLSNLKSIAEAMEAGERMMQLMKRVPKIDSENSEGQILERVSGEVEFRHIEFAYPSRPESIIFKDFSLKIPAGKTVALVGGSGSGKSTVISLLQRFYDPIGGEILLDGVATDKLQLKWLRSLMGLVSQEPVLFATTIKENILFGKEDATMEEVIEAAKASNAHNFISQLPQQYETQVGERGVQLSGGQKQRIAIARALIKAPRILLLDEATSALDSKLELVVQEALDNAAIGRTTIIIAHRLSTIRYADVIAVVQNGHVIETGSHDELMQDENGHYTTLFRLQQTEKEQQIANTPEKIMLTNLITSSSMNGKSFRTTMDVNATDDINDQRKRSEDDNKVKLPSPPSFTRLLALNLPEWKLATLGCLSAILSGAVQPVYAFFKASTIHVFFLKDHDKIKEKTKIYALCMIGLGLFSLLVNLSQYYNFSYMGERLTKRIRERLFSKILTFEVGWFDREENSSGATFSRLAKDANVGRSLVGDRMCLIVQTVSAVAMAFTMSLVIAWRLALVMIAFQPLSILCIYSRKALLKNMSEKAIKAQDESSKLASEAVSNLRTITAFSSQDRIMKRLEKAQEGPLIESVRQSWYAGIGLAFAQSLTSCIWAFHFLYGGKLMREGHITSKAFFQTLLILLDTGRLIAIAGTTATDLAQGSDSIRSIFAVLDRYTRIQPDESEGYAPEKITGHVEFQDVHFAYPARPEVMIFKGFSINIEAGKSVALIGQSGSGKSKIINLIERFYDPLSGMVKIDGRDIKSYHLKSLRKHIALVSQEPVLFSGSIRENIIYGKQDQVDESEIIEAARAANAHDFIAGLSDGYDTLSGERGVQLSGGQKQRIALARAILKNATILLLDETTSALDSKSEKLVQEVLEHMMIGKTSVVIAHRLSTIQNCDLILVLDKGCVVEKGSHQSLLAKGSLGAYYSLVSLQSTPNSNAHSTIN